LQIAFLTPKDLPYYEYLAYVSLPVGQEGYRYSVPFSTRFDFRRAAAVGHTALPRIEIMTRWFQWVQLFSNATLCGPLLTNPIGRTCAKVAPTNCDSRCFMLHRHVGRAHMTESYIQAAYYRTRLQDRCSGRCPSPRIGTVSLCGICTVGPCHWCCTSERPITLIHPIIAVLPVPACPCRRT
jgi:hypothetical protein